MIYLCLQSDHLLLFRGEYDARGLLALVFSCHSIPSTSVRFFPLLPPGWLAPLLLYVLGCCRICPILGARLGVRSVVGLPLEVPADVPATVLLPHVQVNHYMYLTVFIQPTRHIHRRLKRGPSLPGYRYRMPLCRAGRELVPLEYSQVGFGSDAQGQNRPGVDTYTGVCSNG